MPSPQTHYDHPSAWRGPEIAARADWLLRWDEDELRELEAALQAAKTAGLGIPALSSEHVDVPLVRRKMAQVRQVLEDGRGFVLMRGLPRDRYSKSDIALIYWIVGTQLGKAFAQNAHGDMLGHVRDLGADFRTNPKARGYQTRLRLPFHVDSTDVVGLLCLQKARSGGASRIVSSTAIHNEMLVRRPDLHALMCETFCLDRRGEENPGHKPFYRSPVFQRFEGRLFVRYNRTYVESAQRFEGVPPLTPAHREAFDMIDALCDDPTFHLDMAFEPGDMQFITNYTVMHSRAAYEDWPEPERKRHLLRLWLNTPGFARLPPSFAERAEDMVAWQRNPRTPVFDLSEIEAELAH